MGGGIGGKILVITRRLGLFNLVLACINFKVGGDASVQMTEYLCTAVPLLKDAV